MTIKDFRKIRKNEYRMLNADGSVNLAHYEPEDYKIADTIEELCDCLMFVDKLNNFVITEVNEINISYSENETCYACLKIKLPNGAIRIESVAKFNEKWSFELI